MAQTNTKRTISPFRADIVGSFLRPTSLKEAREKFAKGEITAEDLRQVEDTEIIHLINQQVEAGLKAVTDGEFRRSWWHLDFLWGLNGVEKKILNRGRAFFNMETRPESAQLVGELSGENHPFVDHFKFTIKHTPKGIEARQSIPAPAQLFNILNTPNNIEATRAIYKNDEDLIEAIAQAYAQVLQDLYEAGAKTVQFDDTTWGYLCEPLPEDLSQDELTKEIEKRKKDTKNQLTVNNRTIDLKPKELNITTHICRGNYRSSWTSQGPYDAVSTPLFDKENVNAYYLEFDSERAGGFQPLEKVSDDKLVVLGLITSKTGELEDRTSVISRIKEASQYIPLDRLALSTQCGFASTEEGNELTQEQQWAKIGLVTSIAKEVWGE